MNLHVETPDLGRLGLSLLSRKEAAPERGTPPIVWYGYLATWLPGYLATWLPYQTWLPGYLAKASFLTAVYINDILHTKLADVAWAYLRSWFFFDLLMLAPEVLFLINMLSQPEGGEVEDPAASGLLRALRARRLLKVVRFVRLLRFRKAFVLLKKFSCCRYMQVLFNGWISSALVPVLCLMFGLGIAVHFLASLWFVAGTVEHGWAFVEGLHEAPFFQQYVRSFVAQWCHFPSCFLLVQSSLFK